VHHVLLRGIERRAIFIDDFDREDFLGRLQRQLVDGGAACFAWALIPNHVHLVLRTGDRPLSRLMSCLNTGYARAFNLRHRRSGYLFQNRYRSILVENDAYLLTLVRYVHLNPLKHGLVPSMSALVEYPWCGHAGLMGQRPRGFHTVEEVLSWLDADVERARRELHRWMQPSADDSLGSHRSEMTALEPAAPTGGIATQRRRARSHLLGLAGWSLDVLVDWVCASNQADPVRVRAGGRSRAESRARALIGHFATMELGTTALEAARATGVGEGPMSRAIRRGTEIAVEEGLDLPETPPR
jgi:REP element-mobilizing transposase RayT